MSENSTGPGLRAADPQAEKGSPGTQAAEKSSYSLRRRSSSPGGLGPKGDFWLHMRLYRHFTQLVRQGFVISERGLSPKP